MCTAAALALAALSLIGAGVVYKVLSKRVRDLEATTTRLKAALKDVTSSQVHVLDAQKSTSNSVDNVINAVKSLTYTVSELDARVPVRDSRGRFMKTK